MSGKVSTLVGALIGLALAAGLLYPEADETTLLAQGLTKLLQPQVATDIAGEDAGERGASVFSALDVLQETARKSATFTLDITVDGEQRLDSELLRAFATRYQEAGHARAAAELEPLKTFVPPGGPSSPTLVRLDLTTTGGARLQLATSIWTGAEQVWPRADFGPPADAEAETYRLPGREALIPPLIAIMVALLFRKTLLALFLGIFTGAALMQHLGGADLGGALFSGFLDVFRGYFWTELVDTFRVEIIGFVIALVAMVGVMSRSGGVHGLIDKLVGFAKSVRSTLFVTWGMGLLIFFDDYANCLLVGNTMRPLSDRMRISREKLAYIVDSTAAPIAGVSILSTWIAYEVSTYEAHLPAAGITESAYAIFLRTIPYRYYCLFTLMFVFLTILLRRDYGPMRKAEARARTTGLLVREGGTPMVSSEATRIEPREGMNNRWFDAVIPISTVLLWTLWTIFDEGGGQAAFANDTLFTGPGIAQVLFDGSGGKPIFYGAAAGFLAAVFLSGSIVTRLGVLAGLGGATLFAEKLSVVFGASVDDPASGFPFYGAWIACLLGGALLVALITRGGKAVLPRTLRPHLPFDDIQRASVSSLRALFFAILILFQAWMIGAVCGDIGTADYLVALLSGSVSAVFLPVLLFGAACLVAFATGSSWSTMAILLPNVVALAAAVGVAEGMGALAMVVLCIGAVLEGSIFGDHCSPISDTTVLSSVASASDHIDHVRTQAPYALTTASLAVGIGYIPTVALDWWSTPMALGTGFLSIVAVLMIFGRKAPEPPAGTGALAEQGSSPSTNAAPDGAAVAASS